MSLNLEEKKAIVAEVSQQLVNAQAIVAAEYRGISVAEMTALRAKARQSGVYLRVLKNTLMRRSVEGTAFSLMSEKMVGPLVFGISSDPVAVAKLMVDFAKEDDKLVVKVGALSNQLLDPQKVKELALIPAREVLLSQLMGTMQAPIAKFVRTLNEIPTSLVRVLAAIRDQKQAV